MTSLQRVVVHIYVSFTWYNFSEIVPIEWSSAVANVIDDGRLVSE